MRNKAIIDDFCAMQTCSERRLNKYRTTIANCSNMIDKDLSKLKITDVTTFLRNLNNSEYSEWTKNDYKKIFKAFLKHNYKQDILDWMENQSVKEGFRCASKKKAFNKEKINKNTLLKQEEIDALLLKTENIKWKTLIALMYECAFRPCELVNLKWKDLNFNDSKGICNVTTISPKTKEKRDIPVKDCIGHLKRWREEYEFKDRTQQDYVFPSSKDRKKHLSENGICVILKRLCKNAEIRPLFPYIFRHSRIYFIQKRLGARLASKYAGHSLETSEIYNHLDSDDVEEAMLEKVYSTKELTPDEKSKLEKEVEKLKKQNENSKRIMTEMEEFMREQREQMAYSNIEKMKKEIKEK